MLKEYLLQALSTRYLFILKLTLSNTFWTTIALTICSPPLHLLRKKLGKQSMMVKTFPNENLFLGFLHLVLTESRGLLKGLMLGFWSRGPCFLSLERSSATVLTVSPATSLRSTFSILIYFLRASTKITV